LRLAGFDYETPGAYFVTVCTHARRCFFDEIVGEQVVLSTLGELVRGAWLSTQSVRRNVMLYEFAVMPNHLHAILFVLGDENKGRMQYAPTEGREDSRGQSTFGRSSRSFRSPAQALGAILRGFKAAVTSKARSLGVCPRQGVWQRNFYEHVIRSAKELNAIRQYIIDNPANSAKDAENPGTGK